MQTILEGFLSQWIEWMFSTFLLVKFYSALKISCECSKCTGVLVKKLWGQTKLNIAGTVIVYLVAVLFTYRAGCGSDIYIYQKRHHNEGNWRLSFPLCTSPHHHFFRHFFYLVAHLGDSVQSWQFYWGRASSGGRWGGFKCPPLCNFSTEN